MAKTAYIGVGETAREVKKMYIGVDGVAREVKKAWIGVNGIARLFYENGLALTEIPEGSLISINENGSPVLFYVGKHNYESSLNGAGRVLLVRKDGYGSEAYTGSMPWHSSNVNAYATSTIDAWLNGNYKNLFSDKVKSLMGTTTFYYTPSNGVKTVSSLSRSVFLLSVAELGFNNFTDRNKEGSALPIASTLKRWQVTFNGYVHGQWTRTPMFGDEDYGDTYYVCACDGGGFVINASPTHKAGANRAGYFARPAFTLPNTAVVNPEPNADGSYTLIV